MQFHKLLHFSSIFLQYSTQVQRVELWFHPERWCLPSNNSIKTEFRRQNKNGWFINWQTTRERRSEWSTMSYLLWDGSNRNGPSLLRNKLKIFGYNKRHLNLTALKKCRLRLLFPNELVYNRRLVAQKKIVSDISMAPSAWKKQGIFEVWVWASSWDKWMRSIKLLF